MGKYEDDYEYMYDPDTGDVKGVLMPPGYSDESSEDRRDYAERAIANRDS